MTKLYDNTKGYILATQNKNNFEISINTTPHVHETYADATAEAKRLLQNGTVNPKQKRVVILKVEAYVELQNDPFKVV